MREWVPVPGSTRGDLALAAVREFAALGYAGVAVTDLATAAGVTTGALYHHFGSKKGLYRVVRDDVERRVLDRMEGAAQARAEDGPAAAVRAALLVGFDWASGQGMARLLAEPHPGRRADPGADPVAELLAGISGGGVALAAVLVSAWRAALWLTTEGTPANDARQALAALRLDLPVSPGGQPSGPVR
ncbi:TetR/AcrR family transcriptional regulator [Pseudonocardia acaciae]|uniref:TetR/AcrR family transcriptional regulator n=1 Tax=Pseudonocardia acaciae TaxID=551276 RepID=UPI000564769E|nr:TetR/AcrR family transcriptional regulator [Pseudonocardia acaciae]